MEVRYPPPPQKGVSQRYLRDTYENKANGCDTRPPKKNLGIAADVEVQLPNVLPVFLSPSRSRSRSATEAIFVGCMVSREPLVFWPWTLEVQVSPPPSCWPCKAEAEVEVSHPPPPKKKKLNLGIVAEVEIEVQPPNVLPTFPFPSQSRSRSRSDKGAHRHMPAI